MNDFKYSVTDHSEEAVLFKLLGRLIQDEVADDMLAVAEEYLEQGKLKLLLDLSKLEYINSSGLNSLVNILTKARSKGGEVILCNLSEKVKSLFIVTKLNTVFTVVDSIDSANEHIKNN